ncbi:MAG TPA: tetratricopeptide repeat protein [Myxococcaceae bacterium]
MSASAPPPPSPPGSKPPGAPAPPALDEKRIQAARKVLDQALQLARSAEPNLFGKEARDWFEKLDVAHQNTVMSMQFALVHDLPRGLALGALLWRYWVVCGHIPEVRSLVDEMIERAGAAGAPPEARLPAAVSAAFMAYFAGDDARAEKLAVEFLPVAEKRPDPMRTALLQLLLGWGLEARAEYVEAKKVLETALDGFRQLNHSWGIAVSLMALGELARIEDDFDTARKLFDEDFRVYQKLGDHQGMAVTLINLGFVALHNDDLDDARSRFLGGMQILRNLGSQQFVAAALFGMACLKLAEAAFVPCARLLGAATALLDHVGGKLEPAERLLWVKVEAAVTDRLGQAVVARSMEEGKKIPPDRLVM